MACGQVLDSKGVRSRDQGSEIRDQGSEIRGQGSEIRDQRTVARNANAAGMSRRARACLSADGNSMRREGEIICKAAGAFCAVF